MKSLAVILCALSIIFASPAIGLCIPQKYSFEGTVSGAWYAVGENLTFTPLEYHVGQAANGFLYWNNDDSFAVNEHGDIYPIDPASPLPWAEIFVGDINFYLTRNYEYRLAYGGDEHASHLNMERTHSSIFGHDGLNWILDIPRISLNGPAGIFNGSGYPNNLDLSLFDSGTIRFQIFSMDPGFDGSIRIDIDRITAVPEPSTALLLLSGIGIWAVRRKIRKKS